MVPDAVKAPTVSCVIIFWNSERFIDDAVESVLAQTGREDWELILVDDGSTDGSTAKAIGWTQHECGRIRYISHPGHRNEGMSASRNLGIRAARGEFVAFLDSDDIWLPAMLAQRIRLLRNHPEADAVFGPTWNWYGWTGRSLDRRRDSQIVLPHVVSPHDLPLRQPVPPPGILVTIYSQPSGWLVPGICSFFFRREALLEIGGFDDEFKGLFEDQVLYVKAFVRLTFVLDDRPLTLYRQHDASACAVAARNSETREQTKDVSTRTFVDWMAGHVRGLAGTEEPVWRAVEISSRWGDGGQHPSVVSHARHRLRFAAERVSPRTAGALTTTIRRRSARNAPCVPEAWTRQFVGAWASSLHGRVLMAHGRGRPPSHAVLEIMPNVEVVEMPLSAVPLDERFDWILVLPAVFDEMATSTALSACCRLLHSSGSILALVPGCDFPSTPGASTQRVSRADLVDLASAAFPLATISWEGFGSNGAIAAIRRHHDAARAGIVVDHHDPLVEAMTGLSITPDQG